MIDKKDIDTCIDRQRSAFLGAYKSIVESPSISSDPTHKEDVEETARIACDLIGWAGGSAKIVPTKGNPVVFGRIENQRGAPTVAIYNHLDVQPATKGQDGWTRDPFKFTEEKGRYYGRGSTDDKGPALTALWAAKIARELKIPTNVEFIWECEEEIGSPNFAGFIKQAKSEIQADSVVVSDTIWIARGKPALTRGLRGLVGLTVRIQTGEKDTHSGLTGGPARNPLAELCSIVAQCVDAKTGDILVPGFTKTWTKPTAAQRKAFVEAGFDVARFKKAHGLKKLRYEDAGTVASRIFACPTCEVHGLTGGYQGPGLKTIVPPFGEVKLTFRLIPGQDPDEIFALVKKHIQKISPDAEIQAEHFLKPYAADTGLPQVKAIKKAVEFGFGVKPAEVMEGGSIGAVVTMDELLKVPVLFMGLSLPEDSYHGPDESFAWEQIEGGVRSFVNYFELLGGDHS